MGAVTKRATIAALGASVLALFAGACSGDDNAGGASDSPPATIPQPSQAQLQVAGLADLPLAPESKRLDIAAPTFSNPTEITNPLFPISDLQSVIFSGHLGKAAFHTETTLLPETRMIEWSPGQLVEARVSQYFAYVDGRIEEVALDHYAQADDGSVWYLGEDVYDYRDGSVYTTEGTWLAGREGTAEMIMPADPQVGDVHRAENIPGIAFEEVTVKKVGETVDGPAGPVEGAMIGQELHDDGTFSDKVFAPGYGEFFSGHGSEVEALALAVPTDALEGAPPTQLETLASSADDLFAAVESEDSKSASMALDAASGAWSDYRAEQQVPPRLAPEMRSALDTATAAIDARDQAAAGTAAIDVAQSTLDLQLRYQPPTEIDLARFELWARQVAVDAAADELGAVTGDVATLVWIRDRFVHTLDPVDRTRIDTHLLELQGAVGDEDLPAAAPQGGRPRGTLGGLPPPT